MLVISAEISFNFRHISHDASTHHFSINIYLVGSILKKQVKGVSTT